jgi:hypothetical protein
LIDYQEMLLIARQRMNYPQVASIIVSPRTLAELLEKTLAVDIPLLGRLAISASDFAPDDVALGRDHEGRIVKMWSLR